jgi:predicted HAD superfamily Cof-like phosphohydrolase
MTNFEKVVEFHKAFHHHLDKDMNKVGADISSLRLNLIAEEYREFLDEVLNPNGADYKKVSKELADLLYVLYGFAATFGIEIDHVFDLVHDSNMSKLDSNGKPVIREDGKILKSENYRPPNLDQLVFHFK